MHTILRVRVRDDVFSVTAIASVKVAGYQFLIHPSVSHDGSRIAGSFTATYAPAGMGGGNHPTIEDVVSQLERHAESMERIIESAMRSIREQCMPEFAPEGGIEVDDWKLREQERFLSGEYQHVPVVAGVRYPTEHYVHLSITKTEGDFVAYTPNASYGEGDRQVRLKFGKYLRKTFPSMTDAQIQSAVTELRSKLALEMEPVRLKFATDRATINKIFETEMCARDSNATSCMYGKFKNWDTRPYHVYADSPDVAVAYMTKQGRIIARSVVSTKDEVYVRAYSVSDGDSATDCEAFCSLLRGAGYRKGDLDGNRLTNVGERDRSVILPYVDNGGMYVKESCDGKWWVVTNDAYEADYECDQTDGTASECVKRCSGCEQPEDDCECEYCDCCEESYPGGCDNCFMCEHCDGCREHDGCSCNRCSECRELLEPPRGYWGCRCDRCGDCGELEGDCECVKCDECGELETECECEEEGEIETEGETPIGVEMTEETETRESGETGNHEETPLEAIA